MPANTIIFGAAIATNAIFAALTPNLGQEIQRWALPISVPLQPADLERLNVTSPEDSACYLHLRSGWNLGFIYGTLTSFTAPDRTRPPTRSADGRLGLADALIIASNCIARAGLSNTETWLNLRPEVEEAVPPLGWVHRFGWYRPDQEDEPTADVTVDCCDGAVVDMHLWCLRRRLLWAHHPAPPEPASNPPQPGARSALLTSMAEDLNRWSPRLGLGIGMESPTALDAAIVRWHEAWKDADGSHWITVVRSTGWELTFWDGKLRGWRAPDAFFDSEHPPDLRAASGRWRLSKRQAVALVRRRVAEMKIHHKGLDALRDEPETYKPKLFGPPVIPRYHIEWQGFAPDAQGGHYLQAWIEAEVDADRGKVTMLGIYLWHEGTSRMYAP